MGAPVLKASEHAAAAPHAGAGELFPQGNETLISAGLATPQGQGANPPAGKVVSIGRQGGATYHSGTNLQSSRTAIAQPVQSFHRLA